MYLVVNYNRRTQVAEKRAFDKLSYARQTQRNWELNAFLSGSDRDREIVILEARSYEDFKRTHGKYFGRV